MFEMVLFWLLLILRKSCTLEGARNDNKQSELVFRVAELLCTLVFVWSQPRHLHALSFLQVLPLIGHHKRPQKIGTSIVTTILFNQHQLRPSLGHVCYCILRRRNDVWRIDCQRGQPMATIRSRKVTDFAAGVESCRRHRRKR